MTRRPELDAIDVAIDDPVVGLESAARYAAAMLNVPPPGGPPNEIYNAFMNALTEIDARPVVVADPLFSIADLRRAWRRVRAGGVA